MAMPLRSSDESLLRSNSADVAFPPSPREPAAPVPAIFASCATAEGMLEPENEGTPCGTSAAKDFSASLDGADAKENRVFGRSAELRLRTDGDVASAVVELAEVTSGATARDRDAMFVATIDAGTFLDETAEDSGATADFD
jgi:hypothetical protein